MRSVVASSVLTVCFASFVLATDPLPVDAEQFGRPATQAEYFYTFNQSAGNNQSFVYARYSIPDLKLLEVTGGGSSNLAFGTTAIPYFSATATGHDQTAFAVFEMPLARNNVPAVEQFAGLCGTNTTFSSYPFATDKNGDFYNAQACSSSVEEFRPGKSNKAKKPVATFTGGNLGPNLSYPLSVAVDRRGDVYAGDNAGGITYFASGSDTPSVLVPTGHAGPVLELTLDANDDVWSTVLGGLTSTFDAGTCHIDPSGTVQRNVVAIHFSHGSLVHDLYSIPESDSAYNSNGSSVAVDSKGRAYVGVEDPNSAVLEYSPGQACPDPDFKLNGVRFATPELAVDREQRFYVTDYVHNTISVYPSASTKAIKTVVQPQGLSQPLNAMLGGS